MSASFTAFYPSHEDDHEDTSGRVGVIEKHIVDDEEYGDPLTNEDFYCRAAKVDEISDRGGPNYMGTILDFGGVTVVRDQTGVHFTCADAHVGSIVDRGDVGDHGTLMDLGGVRVTRDVIGTHLSAPSVSCVDLISERIRSGDTTLSVYENYLNIADGVFTISQGAMNVMIDSQVDIVAPNIHEASHLDTTEHVVRRPADNADGLHMTNLVVNASSPFAGNGELRPGLNFEEGTTWGDLALLAFGRIQHYPYHWSGGSWVQRPDTVFRFGATDDDTNQNNPHHTGVGIYMQGDNQNSDGKEHRVEIGVSANLPSIRITATKTSENVPFLECIDSTGLAVAAISYNGDFSNAWHGGDLSLLADNVAHSTIIGPRSLYVGSVRMSWDQASALEEFHRLIRIPITLQSAPYSITNADLPDGRDPDKVSVQEYLQLAIQKSGTTTLRAVDILTSEDDWAPVGLNYANTLTSSAQAQLNTLDSRLDSNDQDITNLGATDQAHATSIGDLETTSAAQAGTITALTNTVSGNTAAIAQETSDRQSAISNLDVDLTVVEDD
jgi:hypothetical protein